MPLQEAAGGYLCIYHLAENKFYHTGFHIMGFLQTQSKSM